MNPCLPVVLFGALLCLTPLLCNAQVRINEVLVVNRSALTNNGTLPGYIELFNAGTNDVNIGGWRLSDNPSLLARSIRFPPNTIIRAQSHLLVYCDANTNAPGLHTGFELNPKGGVIWLLGPTLSIRDRVTLGFQCADHSVGRFPDGTGPFELGRASPGASNNVVVPGNPSSLRINEWLAESTADSTDDPDANEDWFELYNAGPHVVDLSGRVWSDRDVLPVTNAALPQLSFIGPRGFIRFFADDRGATRGNDHLDFKLSSTLGDQIILYDSNRTTQIARIEFRRSG